MGQEAQGLANDRKHRHYRPVWTYLHKSDAASPELLAAGQGLAVLLPDTPLHRRIAVHYLYLPGETPPAIYGSLTIAMEQAFAHAQGDLAIIHDTQLERIRYYKLRPLRASQGN